MRQRTREMWEREVLEPWLVAAWPTGAALPGPVRELVAPLSQRYGVAFDSPVARPISPARPTATASPSSPRG